MTIGIVWDEKLSARLVKLWKTNSANQIVAIFAADGYAVTRNSIIGRAHRMGLSRKTKVETKGSKSSRSVKPAPPVIKRNKDGLGAVVQKINRTAMKNDDGPSSKPEAFTPRICDVASLRKTIVDLGAYGLECRWADDDRNEDGLHTFCGHPANGHSYCASHRKLVIDHSRMARIKSAVRKPAKVAA